MGKADPARLELNPDAAHALAAATVGDPFALLGPHADASGVVVRAFVPGARAVQLISAEHAEPIAALQPVQVDGLYAGRIGPGRDYRLRIEWPREVEDTADPYAFGPLIAGDDLRRFNEGLHPALGGCLGAHPMTIDGVTGVRFAVWAPNARRVSVVGDFNGWDGRRHPMRHRVEAGVWELFLPGVAVGSAYKYEILGRHGLLPPKSDPFAWQGESPPRTASIVAEHRPFAWTDTEWIAARPQRQSVHAPLSIYEVHVESWRRRDGQSPGWDQLSEQLIPYVVEQGFTHVELLPITAHPFGGSWGYQPLGLYAPQASLGSPEAFKRFVDRCHAAGIGVIADWVPAHFPSDVHGLAHFDGTALFEHSDPREGFHHDWNTLIYNFGRHEVRAFLIGSALHWLEHYHLDGLRVDAVASMLYRDYSRREGEWIPNRYGGRENLEAIDFLRCLNEEIRARVPGALTIAEESTAFPRVSHPVSEGGLGFSYKWNMGWMHDTLRYVGKDPVYRAYQHNDITFGLAYAFSERFVLPLSHDEVVHGKRSLLGRMPGDRWQQFANLRAYLAFMWGHPGKKLLFMGGELAQAHEWNHDAQVDWGTLSDPMHVGVQRLVRDLNRLHREEPALHVADCSADGFRWIIGDDSANSVFVFERCGGDEAAPVLVVCNFTPVLRHGYRVGVPRSGRWGEILNTDASCYGGSGVGNFGGAVATQPSSHGQPFSLTLSLPPLAVVMLRAETACE